MVWLLGTMIILGLLLWAPLRLVARLSGNGHPVWGVEVLWLKVLRAGFDPGGWYLAAGSLCHRFAVRSGKAQRIRETKQEKIRSVVQRWRGLTSEDLRIYLRLLQDGWRAVRFAARGDCRLGLEDPAALAWGLAAFYGSGLAVMCPELKAEADFVQAGFWGFAEISVEVRLKDFVVPVCRFGWAKIILFAHKRIRRGKVVWQT